MARVSYDKRVSSPFEESDEVYFPDANKKQLREALEKLDGKTSTIAWIYVGRLHLRIVSAEQDRLEVMFFDADDTSTTKYLIDPGCSMEDGSINLLYRDYVEDTPIMATVPKAVAIEVAEHFRKADGQLADPSRWKSYEEIFGDDDIDIDDIPF